MLQNPKVWQASWVLATVAAWIGGAYLGNLIVAPFYRDDVSSLLYALAGILAAVLFSNAFAGIVQSFWLPPAWQATRRWVGMSLLGVTAGFAVMMLVGALAFLVLVLGIALMVRGVDSEAASWATLIWGQFALLIGVVLGWFGMGVTVALFQKRVLASWLLQAGGWPRTTLKAWIYGVPVVLVGFFIVNWLANQIIFRLPGTSTDDPSNAYNLTWIFILYPAFIAFITGRTLQRWILESNIETVIPTIV